MNARTADIKFIAEYYETLMERFADILIVWREFFSVFLREELSNRDSDA